MKNTAKKTVKNSLLGLSLSAVLSCSPQGAANVTEMKQETISQYGAYKDGVYTARGQYGGLPSHIDVTVNLKEGTITKVQVKTLATDPTSLDYQLRFAEAVPKVVEGKRITEVKVGKLAGSSGTPVGFNDAINQIKKQATNK